MTDKLTKPTNPKPHKPARRGPIKFTAKAQAQFIKAFAAGASQRHAAAYAGVSEDTVQLYRKRDSAFSAALERAREAKAAKLLLFIEKHAGEDWRAAAAQLRIMFRQQYSDRIPLVDELPPPRPPDDHSADAAKLIASNRELVARFDDFIAAITASRRRSVAGAEASDSASRRSGGPGGSNQ